MHRYLRFLVYAIAMYALIMDVLARVTGGTGDTQQIIIAGFALIMLRLDDIRAVLLSQQAQQAANAARAQQHQEHQAKQRHAEQIKRGLRLASAGRVPADSEAGRQ